MNSHYTNGNASEAILEYLRCVRDNDITGGYKSRLMENVCSAMENIRDDERKGASFVTIRMMVDDERREGEKKGEKKGENNLLLRMLSSGKATAEQIADLTGFPLEKIKDLEAQNNR